MTTKKVISIIVALLLVFSLVVVACGANNDGREEEMGRLAMECLDNGSVGLACNLYHAHRAVEEANQVLAEAQTVYDASKKPVQRKSVV